MSYTQARHFTINHYRRRRLKPYEAMLFDPKDTDVYTSFKGCLLFLCREGSGQC